MLYLVVKPLKIVYKFDTEIQSAVEEWCINILGLNYNHVCFYDKPTFKQKKWPEIFVEVKAKGGYIFMIKHVEVTDFTKRWMLEWAEKMGGVATLGRIYRYFKMWAGRATWPNYEVGKELRWLIKKYGEQYPVRRLL